MHAMGCVCSTQNGYVTAPQRSTWLATREMFTQCHTPPICHYALPTSLSVLAVLRAFATPTNSTPGKSDTQALLVDGLVAFERCSCYAASAGRNPTAFKNLTDSGV